MVTIFMTIFLIINVIIAVDNWKLEVDFVKLSVMRRMGFKVTLNGVILFILDLTLTGGATTLFGIGTGVVGSAVTIFMSNLISAVFLLPKPEYMAMVKEYQRIEKEKSRQLSSI